MIQLEISTLTDVKCHPSSDLTRHMGMSSTEQNPLINFPQFIKLTPEFHGDLKHQECPLSIHRRSTLPQIQAPMSRFSATPSAKLSMPELDHRISMLTFDTSCSLSMAPCTAATQNQTKHGISIYTRGSISVSYPPQSIPLTTTDYSQLPSHSPF